MFCLLTKYLQTSEFGNIIDNYDVTWIPNCKDFVISPQLRSKTLI